MNQEKLDCLEKRAIDAKNHIHADIQKTKSILSNLPPFLASSKVREGVEKDQQHQLNTCALITDLIHALKENNQPIHSTSIIGMDFAADIAEFTFGLNQPVAIIASGEGGRVIARAQYTTAEDCYYLHYRAADGRAVSAWFDESMISPLHEKQLTEQLHSAN
ncbi:MAG: hypothetical protein RR987_16505 [Hafnia sp.]